jgi:DNA-binding NarL/FixJ family response regulator
MRTLSATTTSVVIAKQNRLLGDCLREMLTLQGYRIVGQASTGAQALRLLRLHQPNLALIGAEFPDATGAEIIKTVSQEELPTRSIMYAHRFQRDYLSVQFDACIHGFILSESSFEELIDCLEKVARGERYISKAYYDYLHSSYHNSSYNAQTALVLSDREREILSLIGQGETNRQIADKLCLSPATVNNHRANISKKLNLSGPNALLQYAAIIKNSSKLL